MLPFPALTMLQSPLKKTRYPDAEISEVSSLLISCNPMTSQLFCSTDYQQGVDVAEIVNAVYRCFSNVERAQRELLSRDLALAALCFLRAASLSARFSRQFFRANTLRHSLSSRCFLPRFLPSFFRRVGCGTPTTPRLLHRRHFCLLACAFRAFLLSSLQVPRFPRRRCPNFATAGTVAAGNYFALLGCITASRCCWQACTLSIDEFSHQSMS